jgi:hypothetical protein
VKATKCYSQIYIIGLDYEVAWDCVKRPELTDSLNELQFLNNRGKRRYIVLTEYCAGLNGREICK